MDEKVIILIFGILGYIVSFICGWLGHKCKTLGSGSNTDVYKQLADDLAGDQRRVESSETKLNGVINESERIEGVLDEYLRTAKDNSDVE